MKSRLADGLKMVTFYLAINRPEKQLASSRRLKICKIEVTDVSKLSKGTFFTLHNCVINERMLRQVVFKASRELSIKL